MVSLAPSACLNGCRSKTYGDDSSGIKCLIGINPGGSAELPRFNGNSLKLEAIEECVRERMRRMDIIVALIAADNYSRAVVVSSIDDNY